MSYWFVDTNLGGRNRKNQRPPGPSVKPQHVGWLALNSLYLAVAVFLFLMRPLTSAQTLGPLCLDATSHRNHRYKRETQWHSYAECSPFDGLVRMGNA